MQIPIQPSIPSGVKSVRPRAVFRYTARQPVAIKSFEADQERARDDRQDDQNEDELGRSLPPESPVARLLNQMDQGLGRADRVVPGVGHGDRSQGFGVPDPEDMGTDERILLVKRVDPSKDLIVDVLGSPGQFLKHRPPTI